MGGGGVGVVVVAAAGLSLGGTGPTATQWGLTSRAQHAVQSEVFVVTGLGRVVALRVVMGVVGGRFSHVERQRPQCEVSSVQQHMCFAYETAEQSINQC